MLKITRLDIKDGFKSTKVGVVIKLQFIKSQEQLLA